MERNLSGFLNGLPRANDIVITDIGATRSIRITPEGKIYKHGADRTDEAREILLDPRMIYEALSLLNSKLS